MRSFLLAGACMASMLVAFTCAAQATDIDLDMGAEPHDLGWYVSVVGGWSIADDDIALLSTAGAIDVDLEAELQDSFMAGIAVGAYVNDGIRIEAELSGHWHDADGQSIVTTLGIPSTNDVNGEADAIFLLSNLWLEMPVDDFIRPYIGGGIGLGRLNAEFDTTNGSSGIDDSGWGFAFQVGGGAVFGLTPTLAADIGYRYKVINNAELEGNAAGSSIDIEADYTSHNVLFGLRFTL